MNNSCSFLWGYMSSLCCCSNLFWSLTAVGSFTVQVHLCSQALAETQDGEYRVSEVTLHREVFENAFPFFTVARLGAAQWKSRAVRTPVAITTGTSAGLDHSCRHLLLRLPRVCKGKTLAGMSKQASGCKLRTWCSRRLLVNWTAEKYLIKSLFQVKSQRGITFTSV